MAATEHLYYEDPLLLRFEARVLSHASWKGAPSVILDKSAFYAEAGGQMADRGELAGHAVIDVQIDDDDMVHHVLEAGALPEIGSTVGGQIDYARRRLHMALHTGQHMISQAVTEIAGANTVSARLGETTCTIDLDRDAVDERKIAEAEALVNKVIDDDLPVRAYFPTRDELEKLPLRSPPKVFDRIRVVSVGDFDHTPCGGTHCKSSAQVGVIRVLGLERNKGKARVVFNCGARARGELFAESNALREAARGLGVGTRDVPAGLERVRRELTEAREALDRSQARVAEHVGAGLVAEAAASGRVVAVLDDTGAELLRSLAARITAGAPEAAAFLAGKTPDGLAVIVARGASSKFDCGAFLKKATAQGGGRGGGRPERAEGRLPAAADWPALVVSLTA
jgi:alanyl-tRNA synthetase